MPSNIIGLLCERSIPVHPADLVAIANVVDYVRQHKPFEHPRSADAVSAINSFGDQLIESMESDGDTSIGHSQVSCLTNRFYNAYQIQG